MFPSELRMTGQALWSTQRMEGIKTMMIDELNPVLPALNGVDYRAVTRYLISEIWYLVPGPGEFQDA